MNNAEWSKSSTQKVRINPRILCVINPPNRSSLSPTRHLVMCTISWIVHRALKRIYGKHINDEMRDLTGVCTFVCIYALV